MQPPAIAVPQPLNPATSRKVILEPEEVVAEFPGDSVPEAKLVPAEYIDKVIAAIHVEKGEKDGELVTDAVQVTVETIDAPVVLPPEGAM